jgi:hypothetical protein
MPQNHILLETINLTQSAASVTFDNLPSSGYTDLKIVVSARTSDTNTGTIAYVKFNGSSSTYSSKFLQGRGDTTSSGTGSTSYGEIGRIPGINAPVTDNVFSNTEITIPNYLSSNNKTYSVDAVTEANQTIAYAVLTSGSWATANPITSILIASTAGNLVADSTFSLYGVAATGTTPAIAPFASGGNIVANDGTYWYHAFLSSGTFTPFKALSCDMLVVAGGGAGGASAAGGTGGGGAGGLLGFTSQSLTAINHTVTVGAGGAAQTSVNGGNTAVGNNGSNSVFGALTAAVGGGGGAATITSGAMIQGNTGGSGGGTAHWNSSATVAGGARTTGQGFAGGQITGPGSSRSGTGGGGAGAAAANSTGGDNTAGGIGATFNTSVGGTAGPYSFINAMGTATSTGILSSSNYYYAGGGGGSAAGTGGAGGIGGGGAGMAVNNANGSGTSGTSGTGGGGGGASSDASGIYSFTSGSGGSGIVIVRYPMV